MPPPGLGVPAALSWTMTTSRGSSPAPSQVIPVRVTSTATLSRYVPGAMTSVQPLPFVALTAAWTVVKSPWPEGST